METQTLVDGIKELRRRRNAVILAHNYQIPEIQDLADYVGDSLGLAREAAKTEADVIVFCGVHFMAETAAILCPDKTVLLPDLAAGCSLAESIEVADVQRWRADHPNGVVVSYVNTSAAVKALSDYCCTSGNAVQVVQSIPEDKEIFFLPDMFLGAYVQKVTGRKMDIWMGECHVHGEMTPEDITRQRQAHPDAELLVHPECGCVTSVMYDLAEGTIPADHTTVLSTEGMIRTAKQSTAKQFIVATETGVLHRMKQYAPDKEFYPISNEAVCKYMKMITLEKLHRSLAELVYPVTVPEPTASRARLAIERMLALT